MPYVRKVTEKVFLRVPKGKITPIGFPQVFGDKTVTNRYPNGANAKHLHVKRCLLSFARYIAMCSTICIPVSRCLAPKLWRNPNNVISP